ncbi:MAG: hypothetical protein LUB59_01255 [Candidatus Gastranaerophilales bacterium]|nr:hypothetical protein [Candidatus Gastranaerophilales bacterium]
MEINNSKQVKGVTFKGYQHKKTETGAQAYEFNYMYDSGKYECKIQFFNVGKDKKNNFFIEKGSDNSMEPLYTADVPKDGVTVDPEYDLGLGNEEPFAYRFILKDKKSGEIKYPKEDGTQIEGCTIVTRRGTTVTKQGPMYLASVDTLAPGYVFQGFKDKDTGALHVPDADEKKEIADKIRNSGRTFSNTMGGTLAGIYAKVPEIRQAGNKRIITLPLKGGDSVSSHKYWNANNMLLAGGIGNINDYNALQRQVFKYGMNMVDDGTFTSEGLQGIHFQRAIKWMDSEDKPDEYYFFRMSGIQDGSLGLGVVPENMENLNHKIINSPFDYTLQKDGQYKITKNEQYDPKQPTTLQIFDNSLVSDEQRNDKTKIIKSYAKTTSGNKLAMNTHEDTPMPYSFEINPYEYKKNVENLNEVNTQRSGSDRIKLNTPEGTMFAGYLSGISIEEKHEGGFVCWDANTDMVKMNYFASNYDNELLAEEKNPAKRAIEMDKLRRGNCQVQDMAVSAGKYWTKHVRKVHNEYVAKTLGDISSNPSKAYNRISGIIDTQNLQNPKLPEDVRLSRDVVKNILDDNYEFRPKISDYNDLMNSSLMELPLDAIEFAPDTQGALSSPYLMKRSPDSDHIGESRFDAMNDDTYRVPKKYAKTYNKMNDVFTGEIRGFADKVLQKVNDVSKEKLFDDEGVTEYGQYVIPLVAEDIAKYAVVKALMPEVGVKQLKNGEIAYDYDTMTEKGSLRNIGINGDSQQDEANQIVNKIKSGVDDLKTGDINFVAASITKRFEHTNTNSFKFAEAMVDRSGLGLDWRLDAAKDIADMDSVRNAKQSFDTGWGNVIGFWSKFVDAVKQENPNSYTVAEITDVGDLMNAAMPDDRDVIYDDGGKAIGAMFDIAGITSEADYSFLFNGISNMFSLDFASGNDKVANSDENRVEKLESAISGIASKSIDYKRNLYTFAGNHDKTRMIHALSMDLGLFHSDLNVIDGNQRNRKIAYMIMNDKMNDSDIDKDGWNAINNDPSYFNNVSAKGIANADLLRSGIGKANEELKNAEKAEVSNSSASEEEKQKKYAEIDNRYNTIYAALSKSVADVVNGKYYKTSQESNNSSAPNSTKKIGEKDGFGSKPIPDAFDIVYDQAVEKHGLGDKLNGDDLIKYRNTVDSKATEVGRIKARIITKFLNAISGNPTVYSGDELGMTGGEDKCKNTYLQNRNALDWSIVEDENNPNYRADIAEYKRSIEDISRLRTDDDLNRLEALNNGSMYKLNRQSCYVNGTPDKTFVSAILSQASNGAMAVSVLNPNGISTSSRIEAGNVKPADIWMDGIELKGNNGEISVTPETKFKNIISADESVYQVVYDNDKNGYYIKRMVNGNPDGFVLDGKTAPDGVLMLYHLPENIETEREQLANKKVHAREYYNKVYNIGNDRGYEKPKDDNRGGNIDLTSKE